MNTYLETISKKINNKTAKKAVVAELQAHIEEKKDYYIEIGYTEEEAQAKAIEEMGDAEETAVSLNGLYSVKWYKNKLNIILLFVLLLCFVLSYIIADNCYYLEETEAKHNLNIDFLSLFVFALYVTVFVLAAKFDNKLIPAVYLAFTAVHLIFIATAPYFLPVAPNEELYSIFSPLNSMFIEYIKPLVYACVVLFTKGFFEYASSLHGYDYAEMFYHNSYHIYAIIIWGLFIVWALFIVIKVLCKERMVNTGVFKMIINFIKYPVVAFCAFSIILTSFSTVYTYINRNSVTEENNELHKSVINFIADADISKSYTELSKNFSELNLSMKRFNDYDIDTIDKVYYQKYNNQLTISANSGYYTSAVQYKYLTDLTYTRYPNIKYYNDDVICSESDLRKLKIGMSLKDFMKSGMCYDSVMVSKSSLEFTDYVDNDTKEYVVISFFYMTGNGLSQIIFMDETLLEIKINNTKNYNYNDVDSFIGLGDLYILFGKERGGMYADSKN